MAEGARGQRIDGARWLLHLLAVVLRRKSKTPTNGQSPNSLRPTRPGAREPGELVTGVCSADLIVLSRPCPVPSMSRSQHTRSLSPGRSLDDNQRTQNQRPGIPCMLLCGFGPLCRFFASFFVPQPLQPATGYLCKRSVQRRRKQTSPRTWKPTNFIHKMLQWSKWSRTLAVGRHIFPTQFHMVVLS